MDNVIENTNSIKQPEEWKPIPGYEGMYEISNWGRVKSYKWQKERILSPAKDGWGYYYVTLCKDSKVKHYKIHRLVAQAFVQNLNNLHEVNHIDELKQNNYSWNLEWCSRKYNISYGTRNQRISEKRISETKKIPVVKLDKDENLLAAYESIAEASRLTGIPSTSICYCCKHKYGFKSAKGYIFMYKDEYAATQTQQDQ